MTTAGYRDVHQIRPDLFLGSRPSDHRALSGRFDAVLDLRRDASDASPTELARLGIEYRHFPMTDGDLPDGATARLDELVAWITSRLDQRRRVLVHCDAGASRSALVVGLHLVRTEHLGADQAIASMRSIRPVVQPHGAYVTFLRQASGEALPASAFAYLLGGEPPDLSPRSGAQPMGRANPAHVRMAIQRTIIRGYWGLDTEFLDLDGGARRVLLSVGLAGDDGRTYYAQIEEARPLLDEADDWVKAHVVPLLDCSSWRPRLQVADEVLAVLGSDNPVFVGIAVAHDMALLRDVVRPQLAVPPWRSVDVEQLAARLPYLVHWPAVPQRQHHALVDAKWHLECWHALLEAQVMCASIDGATNGG